MFVRPRSLLRPFDYSFDTIFPLSYAISSFSFLRLTGMFCGPCFSIQLANQTKGDMNPKIPCVGQYTVTAPPAVQVRRANLFRIERKCMRSFGRSECPD